MDPTAGPTSTRGFDTNPAPTDRDRTPSRRHSHPPSSSRAQTTPTSNAGAPASARDAPRHGHVRRRRRARRGSDRARGRHNRVDEHAPHEQRSHRDPTRIDHGAALNVGRPNQQAKLELSSPEARYSQAPRSATRPRPAPSRVGNKASGNRGRAVELERTGSFNRACGQPRPQQGTADELDHAASFKPTRGQLHARRSLKYVVPEQQHIRHQRKRRQRRNFQR